MTRALKKRPKVRIEFEPWEFTTTCKQCGDTHRGLRVLINNEVIIDPEHRSSILYHWLGLIEAIFKHLGVLATVSSSHGGDESKKNNIHIERRDRVFGCEVAIEDEETPRGKKGLAFLRKALTFVGFTPSIRVAQLEKF